MLHRLNVCPENFPDFESGKRKADIRKQEENAKYRAFDAVLLQEWDSEKGFTGRIVRCTVKSVLKGDNSYGLPKGYCRLSFS